MPSPNSATFAYTSRIRVFGHSASISTVYQASTPLRTQRDARLSPLHRNRFLATCWLLVLAPRIRPPLALLARAFSMASKSNTPWGGKSWFSAAIIDNGRSEERGVGEECGRTGESGGAGDNN